MRVDLKTGVAILPSLHFAVLGGSSRDSMWMTHKVFTGMQGETMRKF